MKASPDPQQITAQTRIKEFRTALRMTVTRPGSIAALDRAGALRAKIEADPRTFATIVAMGIDLSADLDLVACQMLQKGR